MTTARRTLTLTRTLTPDQRAAIAAGQFVRVDLGQVVVVSVGAGVTRVRSVLVGRAGAAMRAYLNVCAHQAVPLDVGADSPMSQDGYHLLCHQHGAVYRPTDGYCVSGPCKGEKLVSVAIDAQGDDGDDGEIRLSF